MISTGIFSMRWDVQFGRAIDDDGTRRVIAVFGAQKMLNGNT
jgi:hypothetical protein